MDEAELENIDIPLKERIVSLENQVLELTLEHRIEFPPTACINRFLVIRDRVVTSDRYDGIIVYNIKTGAPVSSIKLNPQNLKGMATDGQSLFLYMRVEDFQLKDSDILIAKCLDDPALEFVTTDFVGKCAKDVNGIYQGLGKPAKGISGVIFPIPLEPILRPSILFAPMEYSNDEHVPRFLVHEDMSITYIRSGLGFINILYNYHFGEGGCHTGCRIEGGSKLYDGSGNRNMRKEMMPERKLPAILTMDVSKGRLEAGYDLPILDEEYGEEAECCTHNLPLVLKGDRFAVENARDVQRNDDMIYVLHNPHHFHQPDHSRTPEDKWAITVYSPFALSTYRARIMELAPAGKSQSKP